MTAELFNPSEIGMKQVTPNWFLSRDADPMALRLFERHYSCTNKNRKAKGFCGPGQKLVLISGEGDAIFAWVKSVYGRQDNQVGINCSVFRNESNILASILIKEAVIAAYDKWGVQRCFTFVNPEKVTSKNPGCCFKKAGWKRCGMTKGGLIIMEYLPK
jgi:hypothetical protein